MEDQNNEKKKLHAKEYNKEMTDMLEDAIRKIEINSQNVSNNECEAIDALWIDKRFVEEYRRLKALLEMFNFNPKERNAAKDTVYPVPTIDNGINRQGYQIKGIVLPKSTYPKFFELLNKTTTLVYPKDFEMAGMIPGLNIPVPRLRYLAEDLENYESFEHYEEMLSKHYRKYGYVVDTDQNGIRCPYPHERLEWIKGHGVENPNYVNPYYQEYYKYMLDTLNIEEEPTMGEKIKSGIANFRNKAENRRHRVKERRSAKEFFTGAKAKLWDDPKNKKKTKLVLFITGAVVLGPFLGKAFTMLSPFLINLLNLIGSIPAMVGPSITGYGHAADGHVYSDAEIGAIRGGLLSALSLVGFGAIAFLRSKWRKKKKNLSEDGDKEEKKESLGEETENYYVEALAKNKKMEEEVKNNPLLSAEERMKKLQEILEERRQLIQELVALNSEKKRGRGR